MRSLTLILLLISIFNFAKGQECSKTFHKTYVPTTDHVVLLDNGKHDIEVLETKGSRILIEVTVSTNTSDAVLNALIKAGRYNDILKIENDVDKMNLQFNNKNSVIFIKGVEIIEIYKLKIFVPNTINVTRKMVGANPM